MKVKIKDNGENKVKAKEENKKFRRGLRGADSAKGRNEIHEVRKM